MASYIDQPQLRSRTCCEVHGRISGRPDYLIYTAIHDAQGFKLQIMNTRSSKRSVLDLRILLLEKGSEVWIVLATILAHLM